MLSKLLKSGARKKILEIFFKDSRQSYYLRELASAIEYSPGSLQRELNSLVADEILTSRRMGNLRFFSLNTRSPYLRDLKLYMDHHRDSLDKHSPQGADINNAKKPHKEKEKQITPTQADTHSTTQPTNHMDTQPLTHPITHPAPQIKLPHSPSPLPSPAPFSNLNLPTFSKPVLTKPHLEKPILTKPQSGDDNLEINIE
jgi:DNA-binding transcriptional ArsR family regulator